MIKRAPSQGCSHLPGKYNLKINTFTPDELNSVSNVEKSEAAFKATGANAVAEPAAMLASGADKLLVRKQKIGNATIAIAEKRQGAGAERRAQSWQTLYRRNRAGEPSNTHALCSECHKKNRMSLWDTGHISI